MNDLEKFSHLATKMWQEVLKKDIPEEVLDNAKSILHSLAIDDDTLYKQTPIELNNGMTTKSHSYFHYIMVRAYKEFKFK